MDKHNTENARCPVCACLNTLIYLPSGALASKEYGVKCFCYMCSYAAKHWQMSRTAPSSLPEGLLLNTSSYVEDIFSEILRPCKAAHVYDNHAYNISFMGKVGYCPNRRSALALPVYSTWNAVFGRAYVCKDKLEYSVNKCAKAVLLSNTYSPEYLFILDDPIKALGVHYMSAYSYGVPFSTMTILPGEYPELSYLQDPKHIVMLTSNPDLWTWGMEKLPKDAILDNKQPMLREHSFREYAHRIITSGVTVETHENSETFHINSGQTGEEHGVHEHARSVAAKECKEKQVSRMREQGTQQSPIRNTRHIGKHD